MIFWSSPRRIKTNFKLIMKIAGSMILALAIFLLPNSHVYAETVYQTVEGVAVNAGDGLVETMTTPAAAGGSRVLRIKGSMPQWGAVSFRYTPPVPTGKIVVRFKVYIDGTGTANYALYIVAPTGHDYEVGRFQIPTDAKIKRHSFVDVDVPINATAAWSELLLKKAEGSDAPSPWIGSISIILP
jgi:hypothetical protein